MWKGATLFLLPCGLKWKEAMCLEWNVAFAGIASKFSVGSIRSGRSQSKDREKKGKNAKKYKIMLSCARSYCSKWYNWFRALIKQYFHHLSLPPSLTPIQICITHTNASRKFSNLHTHEIRHTSSDLWFFNCNNSSAKLYWGFLPVENWLCVIGGDAMWCGVVWCGVVWYMALYSCSCSCSCSYSQSLLLFTADGRPDTDSLTHISNHHVACIHYRFGMSVLLSFHQRSLNSSPSPSYVTKFV